MEISVVSDIISNCEQELFSKADALFSDDGILSQLEADPLPDDISYDFLSLPNNLVQPKQEDCFPTNQNINSSPSNLVPISFTNVVKDNNLSRTVVKDESNSFNNIENLNAGTFSNPPVSSLADENVKLFKNTTKGNQPKIVSQTNNYVSQPTQLYRNIQPNPAPLKTTPLHAVKPLTQAQPKNKTGSNVVTVQSVGQIHVPADQMKQVRFF